VLSAQHDPSDAGCAGGEGAATVRDRLDAKQASESIQSLLPEIASFSKPHDGIAPLEALRSTAFSLEAPTHSGTFR